MIKRVIKIDGSIENFSLDKVAKSIWLAAKSVGGSNETLSQILAEEVAVYLETKLNGRKEITTNEIGEAVEKILIEKGHAKTAKAFILYRENKKHALQDKASLGVVDDLGVSYNTLYILKLRYLKRDEKGKISETPRGMFARIAKCLSATEKTPAKREKWYRKFLEAMESFEFTPGTRTLTNAGKSSPQLANCFVWPIEDDINLIFDTLYKSTLIKKHGGGCGYNFSKVRPEGDVVGKIPNLAAGPVKMIEMFDLMTALFKQEGRYESGNMAVLNVNHPDIFKFISAKQSDGYLSKTNLSIGINDEFMKAYLKDKEIDLVNPRTGEVVNKVKARSILELAAQMAWTTGDPGIINLSAINKGTALANPLLAKRGPIWSTNVCGEIPLYPYESCNLGYVNFTKCIKKVLPAGRQGFDFAKLEELIAVAVRMLDDVIDASWFPVLQVDKAVRDHRRLGIGAVGWAETLALLGIAYDSDEAFALAGEVAKTMYQAAFAASCDLAKEKGPFPLVSDSIWAKSKTKPRNVALLTFPPSSGNAVICETTFGIEPYFALAYEQNVLDGQRLKTTVPLFVRKLKEAGVYSEEVIQKVADNHGSCQGIAEIPVKIQKIFKVAHDINWESHIKMQAALQKWTDNAITKTVNIPNHATPDDIEKAYILAWKLGCKGLTVYRDKTKNDQVFNFGGERKCPNCDIPLKRSGKCLKCERCSFSTCDL